MMFFSVNKWVVGAMLVILAGTPVSFCLGEIIFETVKGVPCGFISNDQSNEPVVLFEEGPLSEGEMERARDVLTGGVIKPLDHSMVQICGFQSFSTSYDPHYIGSPHDYSSCAYYTEETKAKAELYTAKFNISSIGCTKFEEYTKDCEKDCTQLELIPYWIGNYCGLLFPENDCHFCFFQPITLEPGTQFRPDSGLTFTSLVVNQYCTLYQEIPSIKRLWVHRFSSGVFRYAPGPNAAVNSYLRNNDTVYRCECSKPTPETTTTVGPISPTPPSRNGTINMVELVSRWLFPNGLALVVAVGVVLIILRSFHKGGSATNYMHISNDY